jgi:hypothetical protein
MRYMALRDYDHSVPLFHELLAKCDPRVGANAVLHFGVKCLLAWQVFQQKRYPEAEAAFKEILASPLGKDWPNFFDGRNAADGLTRVYWLNGDHAASAQLAKELLAAVANAYGADSAAVADLKADLAAFYFSQSGADLAEPLAIDVVELRQKLDGPDSPKCAASLAVLGLCRLSRGRAADAEPVLRRCLTIREKTQPDAWTTFNAQSMLGGALLAQKKYGDAEPLLRSGYEGMKQREQTIPPPSAVRLPEALNRLIEFYTATNKPDEVKKWRAERARYPAPVEKGPVPREAK